MLVPAFQAVAQKSAGGGSATAMTAGAAYFHYLYALYIAGVMTTAPGTVPPTYA